MTPPPSPQTAAGLQVVRAPNGLELNPVGFTDVLSRLYARKWLIVAAAVVAGLAAAVAALMLPNTYTAMAMIIPPQKEQSAAAALLGQLGPLAAAAGPEIGLKSPADLYVGLLSSRTIADRLADRFQLQRLYQTKTAIDTRAALKAASRITAGRDSLIKIEVEDLDPKRAAAIANAFVAELNSLNKSLAVTDASQRRAFLERRLAEERVALTEAENAMRNGQVNSGLIQPDAQTSVAIGSAAQLRAQITAGEVALERLKLGATSENPEVLRAQSEVDALRAQLRGQERGSKDGQVLQSGSRLPAAAMEHLRRLRDLKYHELLFELLSKQYEAARIDESKAAPDLQVVDAAVPPDKRSGPHRPAIVLMGSFSGGLLAAVVVYAQSRRSHRSSSRPA